MGSLDRQRTAYASHCPAYSVPVRVELLSLRAPIVCAERRMICRSQFSFRDSFRFQNVHLRPKRFFESQIKSRNPFGFVEFFRSTMMAYNWLLASRRITESARNDKQNSSAEERIL